jgi:hypothetical protein
VWLTTVTPSDAPLPRPVGLLGDGSENVFCVQPARGADPQSAATQGNVELPWRRERRRPRHLVGHGPGGRIPPERQTGPGMGGEVRPRVGACGNDGRIVLGAVQRPRASASPLCTGSEHGSPAASPAWPFANHAHRWMPEHRTGENLGLGSPQTLSEADRRIVAVWAADCAERVLGLFEAEAPGDCRPRDAIARLRAFARDELGVGEARPEPPCDGCRPSVRIRRVPSGRASHLRPPRHDHP